VGQHDQPSSVVAVPQLVRSSRQQQGFIGSIRGQRLPRLRQRRLAAGFQGEQQRQVGLAAPALRA